jgi:hypothetical protein
MYRSMDPALVETLLGVRQAVPEVVMAETEKRLQ